MLKALSVVIKYDGTVQGDIDRDAFAAVALAELDNANVMKNGKNATGGVLGSSQSIFEEDSVIVELLYMQDNAGTSAYNTFKSTCDTEMAKSTVLAGSYIREYDCGYDVGTGNYNEVITTK